MHKMKRLGKHWGLIVKTLSLCSESKYKLEVLGRLEYFLELLWMDLFHCVIQDNLGLALGF